MRILLVVHQYLPEHVGGTEVYTWSLAEALTALEHQVTVFYPDPGVERDTEAQQDSHATWRAPVSPPSRALGPLGLFWRTFRNPAIERSYRRALEAVRPDIIHIQHVQNASARLLSLSSGSPLFVTLHDYWFRCATGQLVQVDGTFCKGPCYACTHCARVRANPPTPAVLQPLLWGPLVFRNAYLTWQLTYVDHFIAPSEYVRAQFLRWGFDRDRMTVLSNGIAPQRLQIRRSTTRVSGEGGIAFGYLGALAPSKGLHVLLRAFEAMPPHARLVIYGNEGAFPEYVADLRKQHRHSGVEWAGPVPPERVGKALSSIDYLVVPSLTPESYALVVDEARALGIPVIASRVGALTRIRDGIDGRLFDPGDVQGLHSILKELTATRQLRERYAEAIPRVPTIGEQARRLTNLYKDVLCERRRS